MRICWDNIDKLHLNSKGDFSSGNYVYIYKEGCVICGEPYLTNKYKTSNFCSQSCAQTGKVQNKETRLKKSVANSGHKNPMYGRKRSDKVKSVISKANYKGGFTSNKLASYDTYNDQISYAEKTRFKIIDGYKYLEVKCTYCDKWYIPKSFEIRARKNSLLGKRKGVSMFYCSSACKEGCPTFHKQKYSEGFEKATSREVDPYIRKLCFERDNWQCQKCESSSALHCHHIKSYSQNKIIANDIDNCITLCKKCHIEAHKEEGCRFVDLHCKEEDL